MIPDDLNLPNACGVYLFKKDNEILYIGKSVNIKARVLSHFENAKVDKKEQLIVNNSDKIDFIITDSEFKALLLEAELIQKYHPKYNVIWKDDKSYLYIKITITEKYPKIFLVRKENDGVSKYFGPFSSVKTAMMILREIRRIVPFCMQKKLSDKPCFYSKIGWCSPCPNEIEKISDTKTKKSLRKKYLSNIKNVISILEGNTKSVLDNLQKRLRQLINSQQYEEAIQIRNKIWRFENLISNTELSFNDINFANQSNEDLELLKNFLSGYFPSLLSLKRIECYDVSNLFFDDAVASMVVLTNGLIDRSQYRRFKIKRKKPKSDFQMLSEVIKRRFKNNWPLPDLIVIDGGKPQVKQIMESLEKIKLKIPVIGIAKNPDRIIIGRNDFPLIQKISENRIFRIIQLIRDESHRFARKYHIFLRNRHFLD